MENLAICLILARWKVCPPPANGVEVVVFAFAGRKVKLPGPEANPVAVLKGELKG